MKHILTVAAIFGVVSLSLTAGCDMPPSPPKTFDREVPKALAVQAGADAELAAVVAVETARVNYKYRLEVLRDYFLQKGQLDRHVWATRELRNLEKSMTFRWENVPVILPPKGESLRRADARALVEYAVAVRKAYLAAVDELAQFYERQAGDSYKAVRIRNLQVRFDPIRTYMYFLDAEIPGSGLRPDAKITAADEMYARAIKLHRSGRLGPAITNYRKERQALVLLRKLIRKHPRSTKIALAAYFIAEIYKEYFNENVRAVNWYERAWQWDPTVTEPARFQAAVVYDLRLYNFTKAVELYRLAIDNDPPRWRNAEYSAQRIRELIEQGKVRPATPPEKKKP